MSMLHIDSWLYEGTRWSDYRVMHFEILFSQGSLPIPGHLQLHTQLNNYQAQVHKVGVDTNPSLIEFQLNKYKNPLLGFLEINQKLFRNNEELNSDFSFYLVYFTLQDVKIKYLQRNLVAANGSGQS